MSLGICLFYCCIRRLWSPSIMVYNNNDNISAKTIILTILHLSTSINLHLYIYLYLQIYNTNRFLYHKIGKVFEGWAQEVDNIKKLREMVKAFYALCVKRLRLTPQAVMAFFAPPGEYTVTMSEEDSMKIRRLILSKPFRPPSRRGNSASDSSDSLSPGPLERLWCATSRLVKLRAPTRLVRLNTYS